MQFSICFEDNGQFTVHVCEKNGHKHLNFGFKIQTEKEKTCPGKIFFGNLAGQKNLTTV